MSIVRTRFAPSPTGFLHVGGVRTALFSYLIAKKAEGQFVLRIEDTDKVREVEGSIQHIQDSLHWTGIEWNEGIGIGGEHAPYIQSERLAIYMEWAHKLVEKGRAYADPYSQTELESFREQAKSAKKPFLYREHRPEQPPIWDGTQPLRFKSDPKDYAWNDAVMGDLSTGPEAIDDFILIKSDGYPTYNFCHIIDDMLMGITHVLRSQEFISSTPKFLNLYEALEIERPILATLPFVMAMDGKKKLGKRDGAKDILDYGKAGYLPEAMMNFLATLGWNDGTEQELFSQDELIEKFDLSRVQKSGARFDEARLLWMNGQWIRRLTLEDLTTRVTDFWPESALEADDTFKQQILALVQDRLKTLADLPSLTSFFFEEPTVDWTLVDDNKQLKKLTREEHVALLNSVHSTLASVEDFSAPRLQEIMNELLESTGQKPAVLFGLVRFALTWAPFSPGLPETMEILGKEKVLARITSAIEQS